MFVIILVGNGVLFAIPDIFFQLKYIENLTINSNLFALAKDCLCNINCSITIIYISREKDTLDDEILEKSKIVSEHFFPGVGKPNYENILKGYVDIFSDVDFNAVGSLTARKMAKKVNIGS